MSRKLIDITDEKYGMLTVIEEVERPKHLPKIKTKKRYWLCECKCGNKKVVEMSNLRTGNTTSCGCIFKEKVSKANSAQLKGVKKGKLTGIRNTGKKYKDSRIYVWEFECDCGRKTYLPANAFGVTMSCGHCIDRGYKRYTKTRTEEHYRSLLKSKRRKDNSTGVKGVAWMKSLKKYRAIIGYNNRKIHLGDFDDLEKATEARLRAEKKYHKKRLELPIEIDIEKDDNNEK